MPRPHRQREFALEVVRRLRTAGFEAFWAGGCVRDYLMRRVPKDYDVATNATPEQIRQVFGRRRTLAIGAAFGVITVMGPAEAGMIEVATFRRDAGYSDGRHPDHVTFSSAQEDAARRDFTINGLFYDPVEDRVIDFVGGQHDLAAKLIRAIGDPRERFAEDKLRLLRAVRFSATFGFALDPETRKAIGEMAQGIGVVSPERVAMEMRRMLVEPGRAEAVRLLLATGLAAAVLPEIVPTDETACQRLEQTLGMLERLESSLGAMPSPPAPLPEGESEEVGTPSAPHSVPEAEKVEKGPGFPLALGTLLHKMVDEAGAVEICRRWRLSNSETDRAAWLVAHQAALRQVPTMRWSAIQPLLIHEAARDLLALQEAAAPGSPEVAYCRRLLSQPAEVLNPPPLLTGDDLLKRGLPAGPQYRTLLQRVRAAQLDREINTHEEALRLVDQLTKREEPKS